MNLIRKGDALAIQTAAGTVVGFHARSLSVAELAPELWRALGKPAHSALSSTEKEAVDEFSDWEATDRAPNQAAERKTSPHPVYAVRSLTINIAQICNLACTYCAAGGDGTYGSKTKTPDLSRVHEQLAMLLGRLPNGDRFVITFLGGEPLLYPEIIRTIARDAQLLVAGREIRLRFDIVTNGTLVTPDIAALLASLKANVTVSIDGAPEDNDKARVTKSGKGSSTQVLKGLGELLKVRKQLGSLTAGAVFGKHGIKLIEAWKFLSQYPFNFIKFDFAAEVGDENVSREFGRQMVEVADLAWAKGGETELRRLHTYDHIFQTLDEQVQIENHCLAGKTHLQLDTNGKFTACQWFVGQKDEELGHDTYLDADKIADFSAPLIEKNGCGSCWARHLCGGGCMHINKVKTGSKNLVDQAFCERTRTIIVKGIERYARARNAQFQYESSADTIFNRGVACEVY